MPGPQGMILHLIVAHDNQIDRNGAGRAGMGPPLSSTVDARGCITEGAMAAERRRSNPPFGGSSPIGAHIGGGDTSFPEE